ncbi:phage tail protein [Salmonella enterica subsp. enterica serovar Alachua]|nr:phage tail protein [Salmonella enterica subsp. enterica serovar Alachua]
MTATEGTANVLTFTAKSPFSSYVDGVRLTIRAANTNTGSASLNVNSIGAKTIFTITTAGLLPLSSGQIRASGVYDLVYSSSLGDGSGGWFLLNPTDQQYVPTSVVICLAAPIIPTGFLYCNGQTVSRTTYAALFSAIGTRYGTGDGSTTFALPDYRGAFIRGWDDGRGLDSGRSFASRQENQNQAHSHTISGTTGAGGSHRHEYLDANVGGQSVGTGITHSNGTARASLNAQTSYAGDHAHSFSGTSSSSGGSESRPVNYAAYFAIKT